MALVEARDFRTVVLPIKLPVGSTSTTVINTANTGYKNCEISFLFDCSTPATAQLVYVRYNGRIVGSSYTNAAGMGVSAKYATSEPDFLTAANLPLEFTDENGSPLALTGRGVMFLTYFK